ncbi:uncharacterized protein LOC134431521 [Melospiza melodia melodia]|uniref:uncharacterized protein LOC134431521 n=1 Tax=Melospiza melodia melodia TaxID=1914991 RepID=UPI002FD70FA2
MILTPPQIFTTLIIGLMISIVLPQGSVSIDPWSNAHQCIHPELETGPKGPYFEVYALRNNQPYASKVWDQPSMVAYEGDQIQIGCRELDPVEGKTRRLVLTIQPLMAASEHNLITFSPLKMGKPTVWIQQKGPISCQWSDFREDPPGSQPRNSVIYREDPLGELHPQNITLDLHPLLFSAGKIVASNGPEEGKAQCEMAFRLDQSMTFTCERELKALEMGFGFPKRAVAYKVALPEDVIPLYPDLDLPQETTPPVVCKVVHNLTLIGPQVIRKSNEQKLLLDPTYSLKKVQMNFHTDITYLQKDCQPFIQQSLKGWNAWGNLSQPRGSHPTQRRGSRPARHCGPCPAQPCGQRRSLRHRLPGPRGRPNQPHGCGRLPGQSRLRLQLFQRLHLFRNPEYMWLLSPTRRGRHSLQPRRPHWPAGRPRRLPPDRSQFKMMLKTTPSPRNCHQSRPRSRRPQRKVARHLHPGGRRRDQCSPPQEAVGPAAPARRLAHVTARLGPAAARRWPPPRLGSRPPSCSADDMPVL